MDSWWTPGGLLIQFQEFTWTPDGVHQDAWLSVMTSCTWGYLKPFASSLAECWKRCRTFWIRSCRIHFHPFFYTIRQRIGKAFGMTWKNTSASLENIRQVRVPKLTQSFKNSVNIMYINSWSSACWQSVYTFQRRNKCPKTLPSFLYPWSTRGSHTIQSKYVLDMQIILWHSIV